MTLKRRGRERRHWRREKGRVLQREMGREGGSDVGKRSECGGKEANN